MRLHREDPRVPRWVQEEIETRDHFLFGGTRPGDALLEPILSEHANVRAAAEIWFEEEKFSSHDNKRRGWRRCSGATKPSGRC